MSTKHTPGPWSLLRWNVEITGGDDFMHEIHAGEHSAPVAMIPVQSSAETAGEDGSTDIGLAESLANARLIAAAPETAAERDKLKAINAGLLAALERANRVLADLTHTLFITGDDDGSKDMRQRVQATHEIAYAAIAKATGAQS